MLPSHFVCVDFDGTCVSHDFPRIGFQIGAIPVLKELQQNGHKIILWTIRSGDTLNEAVEWFIQHDIRLYGVNENPIQKRFSTSNKCYSHLYIDDAALGCPLVTFEDGSKPYVDWIKVRKILEDQGYLRKSV